MKKISCFVACAFGKDDVDEIYQNAILPALESMKIKPYRVDLIEHNDDIDDKIIELILKKCQGDGLLTIKYKRNKFVYAKIKYI